MPGFDRLPRIGAVRGLRGRERSFVDVAKSSGDQSLQKLLKRSGERSV